MTNAEMIPGRFMNIQYGRKLYRSIVKHLSDSNGVVVIRTYMRATQYAHKHAGMFSVNSDGDVFVQSGKRRDCINYCDIQFARR